LQRWLSGSKRCCSSCQFCFLQPTRNGVFQLRFLLVGFNFAGFFRIQCYGNLRFVFLWIAMVTNPIVTTAVVQPNQSQKRFR
jgi:hypothetical protein